MSMLHDNLTYTLSWLILGAIGVATVAALVSLVATLAIVTKQKRGRGQ